MKCPNCGNELTVMWVTDEHSTVFGKDEYVVSTVVGHCNVCDYDGQWERREMGLRRYFFG